METSREMTEETEKRPRWLAVLLVVLPLWLLVSGAAGIWWFLHREKQAEARGQQRFARMVSEQALTDDLRKIVDFIGERHASSETGGKGLTRMASMIEGLLGPSNTGYSVRRARGPANWPLIHVSLAGSGKNTAALWIVTSYDSRAGSPGVEANATGLAATLAAAQALAGDQPASALHFAFIPHANDPGSPVTETADALRTLMLADGTPRLVLCVEAMGGGEELQLSARDGAVIPLEHLRGLATAREPEPGLAETLAARGFPAVRVATRPEVAADDPDDRTPPPALLVSSSGRLIELIRRCAANP